MQAHRSERSNKEKAAPPLSSDNVPQSSLSQKSTIAECNIIEPRLRGSRHKGNITDVTEATPQLGNKNKNINRIKKTINSKIQRLQQWQKRRGKFSLIKDIPAKMISNKKRCENRKESYRSWVRDQKEGIWQREGSRIQGCGGLPSQMKRKSKTSEKNKTEG